MSRFEDDFAGSPTAMLKDLFGRTVTYKSGGTGIGTTITVLWNPAQTIPGYVSDGLQEIETGRLRAAPADVASPDLSDTFVIDSNIWAVVGIGRVLPMVELQLERRVQEQLGGDPSTIKR